LSLVSLFGLGCSLRLSHGIRLIVLEYVYFPLLIPLEAFIDGFSNLGRFRDEIEGHVVHDELGHAQNGEARHDLHDECIPREAGNPTCLCEMKLYPKPVDEGSGLASWQLLPDHRVAGVLHLGDLVLSKGDASYGVLVGRLWKAGSSEEREHASPYVLVCPPIAIIDLHHELDATESHGLGLAHLAI